MATKRASAPPSGPAANPTPSHDSEMRSPFIPLLWLLIPFVALIVYGVLTSPH
jgi:hypothetical protein